MKTRLNRRKSNRRSTRKTNRKTRRTNRRSMLGGNTNAQNYKSPFFVNMSDRYGTNIGEGPALSK